MELTRQDKHDADYVTALRTLDGEGEWREEEGYGVLCGLVHEVGLSPHSLRDSENAERAYAKYPNDAHCLARRAVILSNRDGKEEDVVRLLSKAVDNTLSSCDANTFIHHSLCSHLMLRLLRVAPRSAPFDPDAVWHFVAHHALDSAP